MYAVAVFVFESLEILLSFKPCKLLKDQRTLLMELTNKELKTRIGNLKGLSRMNKVQLVEVLMAGN